MPRRRAPLALAALLAAATTPAAVAAGPAPAAPIDLVDRSCRLGSPRPDDAPPFGNPSCPGVRPGAEFVTTVGACTLGFLFTGSDGATYASTAGHCALDVIGPQVVTWKRGAGPVAADAANSREFGRFVYAVSNSTTADFGQIRINPGVKVDPQMCHFGGPTGVATAVNFDPVPVVYYGNGYGMENLRGRTSYAAFGLRRADAVTSYGAASLGDSGAAATTDAGLAVGSITQLVANGNGNVYVQRLAPHLDSVRRHLGLRLTLRTAPLL